jgi:hypothetical protein
VSTPAGLRIRRSVFTVLNALENGRPETSDLGQASASSSG